MKVLIVQTYLHRDIIAQDADIGRRMVLRIARREAHAQMAAIKTYEVLPYSIPGTMAIRAHIWVE